MIDKNILNDNSLDSVAGGDVTYMPKKRVIQIGDFPTSPIRPFKPYKPDNHLPARNNSFLSKHNTQNLSDECAIPGLEAIGPLGQHCEQQGGQHQR